MMCNSWLYSSAKHLVLFPAVCSCLSLAIRIWKGGQLGGGKTRLDSWPWRVVVHGPCCTWWPVDDTWSLQDSGPPLPCSSSPAVAWGRWHNALSGLQWQQARGPVAVLERWACRNLTELSRDKHQALHLWEGRVSGRDTVWGQRGCRKQVLWERPPRYCQEPGEPVPSPSWEFFKSGSDKSLRNLVWPQRQVEVRLRHLLRSFSTWNTLSCNSVTNDSVSDLNLNFSFIT